MRHEKAEHVIRLALMLAGSAEGLTLDEMAVGLATGRRSVERMRDAVARLFAVEVVEDPPTRRFRITGGLRRMFVKPADRELLAVREAIDLAEDAGLTSTAAALARLALRLGAMSERGLQSEAKIVVPPGSGQPVAENSPSEPPTAETEADYFRDLKRRLRSWQNVSAATGRPMETLQRLYA